MLVQWTGLYPEDATWEDFEDIHDSYPTWNLEGKVHFHGETNAIDQEWEEEELMGLEEEVIEKVPLGRPKRNKIKPKWMKDFAMH